MARVRIKWRRLFFAIPQLRALFSEWPRVRDHIKDNAQSDDETADFFAELDLIYHAIVKRK